MKDFLKMTGAVLTGLFIWGCLTSLFLIIATVMMMASMMKNTSNNNSSIRSNSVLRLNLCDAIDERSSTDYSSIYSSLSFEKMNKLGLNNIALALEKAASDDKILGLCINCSDYNLADIAIADELRNRIKKFKEVSGKPVFAFSNSFENFDYYIATIADSVFMRTMGEFGLNGLCSQSMYYKGALDKFGIQAQVLRHGKFKSAVEPYIQETMSDANREQITKYLGDIWSTVANTISADRGIELASINKHANALDLYANDELCIAEGFVDGVIYESDFDKKVAENFYYDGTESPEYVTISKYIDSLTDDDATGTDKIAVLYATGEIVSESNGDQYITSKDMLKEIKKIKDDDNIKAVVLRVNSPGGSATEAEIIHNALMELRDTKPLVVSMGGYAASGGYYISCPAHKIYADPNTITGSIGVFGLLMNPEKLLNKTIGINIETVKTHDMSDINAGMTEKSSQELSVMQRDVERIYGIFLRHVADGRSMSVDSVDMIAQGRVWTGKSALEIGLVDEIGGLDMAIDKAAELAEIYGDASIQEFPEQEDEFSKIFSAFTDEAARMMYGDEILAQKRFIKNFKSHTGVQAWLPPTKIK